MLHRRWSVRFSDMAPTVGPDAASGSRPDLTLPEGQGRAWSATREGPGVELLTIGAFAAASGLSPKALRLYDALGLLAPAEVDARTGYRRYHPDQLEHALLVAWLRRLGMPLGRIRVVTALPRAAAGAEVAAYWRAVEADHAVRRDLVAALVDHLDGREHPMTK